MTHEMYCHNILNRKIAEIFEEDAARGEGCKMILDDGWHEDEQEAIEWDGWVSLAGTLRG